MRGSFWQKDSLITHFLFELRPIIIFIPVANFGDQSLYQESYIYIFSVKLALQPTRLKSATVSLVSNSSLITFHQLFLTKTSRNKNRFFLLEIQYMNSPKEGNQKS